MYPDNYNKLRMISKREILIMIAEELGYSVVFSKAIDMEDAVGYTDGSNKVITVKQWSWADCVLAHEIGHALGDRKYDWYTPYYNRVTGRYPKLLWENMGEEWVAEELGKILVKKFDLPVHESLCVPKKQYKKRWVDELAFRKRRLQRILKKIGF